MSDLTPSTAPTPEPPRIVEPPGGPTERSPADVLRLVVAGIALVLVVLLSVLFGRTLVEFLDELLSGLGALPLWLVQGVVVAVRVVSVLLLVVGFVHVTRQGEWAFLLRVAVAALAGALLYAVLSFLLPDPGGAPVEGIVAPGFPGAAGLGAITGLVTAAAPWLSRGRRRGAWTLVVALTFVQTVSAQVSLDTLTALLAGWLAGAATLVALGGPSRRPSAHAIADGLAEVGLELAELAPASVDARGSTPYLGRLTSGRRVFVKALGDDQRSADLLFRLYRAASRRDLGDERPFSSLRRAVEHEGLVSLAAAGQGIRTPEYLAMGRAEPNGFSLAFEAIDGKSLDGVPLDQMTDELLAACWEQVARLRAHRTAHRDLRLANLFRSREGTVFLIDFGFGELAASDLLLRTDVAELLASTAAVVGPARAVGAAQGVLGSDAVRDAGPRLDPKYLSGATRTALGKQEGVLAEVRRLAASA